MISLPTKEQWFSIIKNTAIAFVATLSTTLSVTGTLNWSVVFSAGTAAIVGALKTIEKLFSEPHLS